MLQKLVIAILTGTLFFSIMQVNAHSKEKIEEKETKIELPTSILSIEQENTKGTKVESHPTLEPNQTTKQLLQTSNVLIDNEDLIKHLNETTIETSPFSLGNKAVVFLGTWPLSYKSKETIPNWDYQKINTNYYDNRYGEKVYSLHYVQESEKVVKGGLTAKVENPEIVRNLLLQTARKKTGLPLAFETTIGAGTKKTINITYKLNI